MNKVELEKIISNPISEPISEIKTSYNNNDSDSYLKSIIKNFIVNIKTVINNLKLNRIVKKIETTCVPELSNYQISFFENIKKILSIIRHYLILGSAKNSSATGIDLLKQDVDKQRKIEEDIYLKLKLIIFNKPLESLQEFLNSYPLSSLDREIQDDIMNNLTYSGCYNREVAELLQKSFYSGIEKKFPILAHYRSLNRALSIQHLHLYGKEENKQKIYHEQQKESVKYALLSMKENGSFRSLLFNLGCRRRHTYLMMDPTFTGGLPITRKEWDYSPFGAQNRTGLYIPTKGAYKAYRTRLMCDKIAITIEGKTYELKTFLMLDDKSGYEPFLSYNFFWINNDPVFAYAEKLYNKIINGTFDDPEELKKSIATFHWLLANCPPFARGTASILETLTDAMWLAHGYLPQPIEAGKSLDLEALCTPESKLDDFIKLYPMGLKPANNLE